MRKGIVSNLIEKYFYEGPSVNFLQDEYTLFGLCTSNASEFITFEDLLLSYLKLCFTNLNEVREVMANINPSLPQKSGMIANNNWDKYTQMFNEYKSNANKYFNGYDPKNLSATHKQYIEEIESVIQNRTEEERI